MIPETEIAKMKERVEKATPGPWQTRFLARAARVWRKYAVAECLMIGTKPEQDWADCDFAAAARTDLPALLAERSELLSKIEEQERELAERRWIPISEMPDELEGERVLLCVIEEVEDCDGITHRDEIISTGRVDFFPQSRIAQTDREDNEYEPEDVIGYQPLPAPPAV